MNLRLNFIKIDWRNDEINEKCASQLVFEINWTNKNKKKLTNSIIVRFSNVDLCKKSANRVDLEKC